MTDIQNRPFSKDYSGLINQSVIALSITVLCVTGQELMKRRRRGKGKETTEPDELGSRESWEFGYLYQGRSWARYPSPPSPKGWPLSWVKQAFKFTEMEILKLRGVDASLYVRFIRGCFFFVLLHTLTTFPILFPIHVHFSDDETSTKSMTRASISSLVNTDTGKRLLWIHICLLFWLTLSWIATLLWICHGAFRLRAENIQLLRARYEAPNCDDDTDETYYPHPHPQYGFTDIPILTGTKPPRGLRWRTVMVSNVPNSLRNEKDMKEYFEYYMTRKLEKPSMGITSSSQPSIINKGLAFLFNRAKRIPVSTKVPFLSNPETRDNSIEDPATSEGDHASSRNERDPPEIERVVIARKMTELASLLRRREEVLVQLESAHIRLANKALSGVKTALDQSGCGEDAKLPAITSRKRKAIMRQKGKMGADLEQGVIGTARTTIDGIPFPAEDELGDEERMEELIRVLGPFVEEFKLRDTNRSKRFFNKPKRYSWRKLKGEEETKLQEPELDDKFLPGSPVTPTAHTPRTTTYPPVNMGKRRRNSMAPHKTIWEALYSLPRSTLDAYQPLINLSHLFRGKTVPSIDYYTTKLNVLNSLITEARAKSTTDFEPVSTAFVTFKEPRDARKACKYLAVHPNNPLTCLVEMAPMYQDLDWERVMKGSLTAEFVKDWVVNAGVWGFTLFWIFPVSVFVGLVSIQNISQFWPGLKRYLDKHQWEEEVIQSFLPTVLVALLALLIPLILLFIAKKAHTIKTLSSLHDRIMTRYYKFLIVNVVVFFCVGTVALQSLLESFKLTSGTVRPNILKIVADSFPTAGPFYVGWLILTTALHGAFEIVLLGLPLIMYPSTSRQITPRKRSVGIRPRTLNFYYWLPNHLLVLHVLLLFSVLNPFVLPFGALYFFVQIGVMKNQLVHVYAKHYECNGERLLIRMVRYTLDGLILSQAVFLAYMVVLKKEVNVGLSAFLIVLTACTKVFLTRRCRSQFERDDLVESEVMCGISPQRGSEMTSPAPEATEYSSEKNEHLVGKAHRSAFATMKFPTWIDFSYKTMHRQPQLRRQPIPFDTQDRSFSRLPSMSLDRPRDTVILGQPSKRRQRSQSANDLDRPHRLSLGVLDETTALNEGPVVLHPPPVPWDDTHTIDLPYDNPYYARPFANVLWLPRNPTGVLDLDDTVDLKVSLTVESAGGRLGNWLGPQTTESPQEIVGAEAKSIVGRPTSSHKSSMINGTEDIDLPSTIAKRVERHEGDVERAQRPPRRRPTMHGDNSLPRTLRSISSATDRTASRSLTSMPSFQFSVERDPEEARSFPAPGESAGPALLAPSRSRMSLASSNKVSVQNAIIQEVIAEEKAALIDRIEDEQAETDKATKKTRSWFTSWMFRKQE